MDGADYLCTVAEVSVAFVGFASIVLTLRHRSGDLGEIDRVLVSWLVERGLSALGFALLPMLLIHFEVSLERLLPIGSGLLSTYLLVTVIRNTIYIRANPDGFSFSRFGLVFRSLVLTIMIPIQALAALGMLPFAPPRMVFAGRELGPDSRRDAVRDHHRRAGR